MASRSWNRFLRWQRAALCVALLATLVAACSLLFDHDKNQCSTDNDCQGIGSDGDQDVIARCTTGVCERTNLGPRGCDLDPSSTNYLNRCTAAVYEKFDNCGRIGVCPPSSTVPPPVTPPDAPPAPLVDASLIDTPPPPTPVDCIDGTRPVVVVAGSTAVQNFLGVVAPLIAPRQIVYLGSGSCNGVDNIFDPAKHVIKDTPGRSALLFNTDGSSVNCTLGSGAPVDVGVSDVFAASCNTSYTVTSAIGEYRGPIQPMTFVVKAGSKETVISAEMAHVVFGLGNSVINQTPFNDSKNYPYTDPRLYFVRNASSGTQQMISRAIEVDPRRWWGIDTGGSSQVRSSLQLISADSVNGAIGILSTDVADKERALHVLAFKAKGQLAGFYPDSSTTIKDKANVRDGHYTIWGPIHFFTQNTGGLPNTAAGELVLRFTSDQLPRPLLDAVINSNLVPPCAMKVQRKAEMSAVEAFTPPYQCGCYFEAKITGKTPAGCNACTVEGDCGMGHCNEGFCEAQ